MTKHVGFVGIGTMGKPMVSNLLKAGFSVTIIPHVNMAPAQALEAEGAVVVKTAKEVAAASDVVVTCLPNSPEVEEVLFSEDGLMAGAKPGLIIIDTSTITPAAVQEFSQKVANQGCTMLDAPMSGGQSGAIAGSLTFMVGGDSAAVDQARDVFDAMGKLLYHVGASGMGATVKLCNNLMLGINLVGVCEAFTLGAKAGVDAQTMAEVVQASSGGSAVIERYFPKTILKNQYEPGFMLKLMVKDMNLALESAKALGVPTFAGSISGQVLDMVNGSGKGDADFTVIATLYQDVADVIIGKSS
jgi:3-hydroxyisobutyrate dehydrogenase